ncbi:MAG: hypothetical protein COB53_01945 [Elusimicrobia bacterium]|nr:MAG: hypothetical protein COB53_01945 [Elusimicrobiota bacterium]
MVSARLTELTDPVDAAVDILEKTVVVALKDVSKLSSGHRQIVVAACKGTLTALLLKEYDLVSPSLKIVHAMIRIANTIQQDPSELTTLSLHGIADMKRFLTSDKMASIRNAINQEFMGAGDMLQKIVEAAPSPDSDRMMQDAPIS